MIPRKKGKGLGKMGYIKAKVCKTRECLVDGVAQQRKLKICNICFNSVCFRRLGA